MLETSRGLVHHSQFAAAALLDLAAPLYLALGQLDTAWVVRKRQLVLVRQLPGDTEGFLDHSRLALADIDFLGSLSRGETSRLPELTRLEQELKRHQMAKTGTERLPRLKRVCESSVSFLAIWTS